VGDLDAERYIFVAKFALCHFEAPPWKFLLKNSFIMIPEPAHNCKHIFYRYAKNTNHSGNFVRLALWRESHAGRLIRSGTFDVEDSGGTLPAFPLPKQEKLSTIQL